MIENSAEIAKESGKDKVSKRFTNPRHRILCYMAASGATQKEMAEATKFHINHVQGLMSRGEIKKEVERLQDKIFGAEPKKKYAMIFPEAVDIARDVMKDKKTKPGVRAAQARDFMNRHSGMPVQKTENETRMISELIMRLDDSSRSKVEDLPTESDNEVIDVTPEKVTEEPKEPEIDVDSWIDENLGE